MTYTTTDGERHTDVDVRVEVQKLIDANGGWWVVGPVYREYAIGTRGHCFGDIPIVLIAESNREEAERDCAILGRPPVKPHSEGAHYYRVMTD